MIGFPRNVLYKEFCERFVGDFILEVYKKGADPKLREELDKRLDYMLVYVEIFT